MLYDLRQVRVAIVVRPWLNNTVRPWLSSKTSCSWCGLVWTRMVKSKGPEVVSGADPHRYPMVPEKAD